MNSWAPPPPPAGRLGGPPPAGLFLSIIIDIGDAPETDIWNEPADLTKGEFIEQMVLILGLLIFLISLIMIDAPLDYFRYKNRPKYQRVD